MVLPEVVRRLVPVAAVAHLVALGRVGAVVVDDELLVEGVVASQTLVPHVGIGPDACLAAVGAVHDAQVVGAGSHAVPSLSGTLEVADVLVSDEEIIRHGVGQAAVVGAGASAGAMDKAVGRGLVVGAFQHEAVPEQAGGELSAPVDGVVRAVAEAYLTAGLQLWKGCLHADGTAKGSVAIGRGTHATLYLHVAEQRAVGVHVGPEHTLVLRRVEGHTVERHIDARTGSTTNAHISGSRTQAVLAPCQHARRLGKEEWQLTAGLRKFL